MPATTERGSGREATLSTKTELTLGEWVSLLNIWCGKPRKTDRIDWLTSRYGLTKRDAGIIVSKAEEATSSPRASTPSRRSMRQPRQPGA
jgi:hypothetical protein